MGGTNQNHYLLVKYEQNRSFSMHPLIPFGSYSHQLVQRFDRLVYNQSLDRILGIETTELPGISCQRNALTVHNTIDLEDGDATERRRGLDGRPIFPEAGVGEIDASGNIARMVSALPAPSKYNSSCFVEEDMFSFFVC